MLKEIFNVNKANLPRQDPHHKKGVSAVLSSETGLTHSGRYDGQTDPQLV